MIDLGICSYCSRRAIVAVNHVRGCELHVDEAVGAGLEAARDVRSAFDRVTECRPRNYAR